MPTATDFTLLARIKTALDKLKGSDQELPLSSESFLAKFSAIADRTRVRPGSPVSIDMADVRKIIGDRIDPGRFVDLAIEAGLLLRHGEDEIPSFRDTFERDTHVARYLMPYLGRDYIDRGRMRDQAVNALIQIGIPAIPQLIHGLGHDENEVRLAAAVALRKMNMEIVPAIIQAMKRGNENVRKACVEALMTPESSKLATDELIHLLLNDQAPLVRASAAQALKKGGTQKGIEALVDALNDQSAVVVSMVKGALKELDTPLARRSLEKHHAKPKKTAKTTAPKLPGEVPKKQITKTPRIFLSYPREDQKMVDGMRQLFANAGFDVWMDSKDLRTGQQWEQSLEEAIKSSDFVVGFLSTHSFDGYQMEELKVAANYTPAGRAPDSGFLLPCITDPEVWKGLPGALPEFLQGFHMIDLTNKDRGWTQLHEAITIDARKAGFLVPAFLRTKFRHDLEPTLVNNMLVQRNFYDNQINRQGHPPYLDFGGLHTINDHFVQDLATHRTWTRGCYKLEGQPQAVKRTLIDQAHRIAQLANSQNLGGFSNWRLPTIEEAMSLMKPAPRQGGLYISELFSDDQVIITSDCFIDRFSPGKPFYWFAYYGMGYCLPAPADDAPAGIRLVRSGL